MSTNNQLEPSGKSHPTKNRVSINLPSSSNNNRAGTPTAATSGSASAHRASLTSTPIPTPHHRNPVFAQHTPSGSTHQPSSTTRFGGLSAKQVDKISSAIASVRDHSSRPQSRTNLHPRSDKLKHKSTLKHQQPISKPSSFSHAPLNSRLPALTPRKASYRTSQQRVRETSEDEGRAGKAGASEEASEEEHAQEEEDESMDADQTGEFLNKLRFDDSHHPHHQGASKPKNHHLNKHKENLKHILQESSSNASLQDGSGIDYQELVIIEDLFFILLGIEGTFIEYHEHFSPDDPFERLQGARFSIDNDLDPSLREIVERILPLATYYTSIDAFVAAHSHLDCGLVNHALCASIRDILKDYMTLVVQLEDQFNRSADFTLQRFWFYVHDMLHTLKLLYSFTTELVCLYSPDLLSSSSDGEGGGGNGTEEDEWEQDPGLKAVLKEYDPERRRKTSRQRRVGQSSGGGGTSCGVAEGAMVKGGEVLAILEERVMGSLGDPIALKLYSDLLLKASQPYCKMLIQWVAKGILDDPYEEFIIKESKSITRGTLDEDFTDEYWERKYVLRNRASTVGAGGTDGHPTTNHGGADAAQAHDGRWSQAGRASWRREKGVWGGAVLPRFLEVWEVKILLAGKYVNVIRECGVKGRTDEFEIDFEQAPDADGSTGLIKMNDDWFYGLIDRAYVSANRSLLELLMRSEDLLGRLRSLKHHFFLSQGDSFTTFLDSASYELGKKLRHVNVSRLQNQFDLAIRNPSSSSSSDPYKEDVKVTMATTSLTDWLLRIVGVTGLIGANFGTGSLYGGGSGGSGIGSGGGEGVGGSVENAEALDTIGTGLAELAAGEGGGASSTGGTETKKEGLNGIDALQLDYTVRFPLSLVISRKTILRYQLIFRYLLHLKHLEQSLTISWTEHIKSTAWKSSSKVHPRLESWKRRIFNLRAKMLSFVQSLYNFICFEVLEKNYRKLEFRLANKVDTVDGLLREHRDFLDTCLKECMLTNSKLLKIHQKLTTACSMFASYTSHFTKSAHSFNLAFQDGNIFNDGHPSTNRPSGRENNHQNNENDDHNDPNENDDDHDDDESEIKRKKKFKKSAASSRAPHKPSHQEIYDKFLLAENALKKFEQNFNHHSQVHVDMVTVKFLFLPLSLSLSLSRKKKTGGSLN
ncbi:hypothetical protein PGT21_027790 [Puccinia graminis f. sp. tritici]|uniref:Spindle pole body component n=1 Tax=Puccinia graminis f. sp. tritici TaxID=56615 RepID=A0A5B0QJ20_PUCGR|nr:hypothetical protein PGT21_027790 [Puccinia graminis f. sp. tritici]